MVHFPSGFTDRDAVPANGKVILVCYLNATLFIEVNEWDDPVFAAEKIVRHGIMCRIQEPFLTVKSGRKVFIRKYVSRKPWESSLEAGFKSGKTGRSLSESEATIIYR